MESIVGRGGNPAIGEIGLTPRAKKVIELAVDEARRLSHRYIGTEHLLLGLLHEAEGVAAGVLNGLGVGYPQARAAIMALIGGLEQAAGSDAPAGKSTVVMCRVDERDLAAIDMLIEAGIRTTRSDAAAWLIHAGIEANVGLFAAVSETVGEIRRLRERAQALAQQVTTRDLRSSPPSAEEAPGTAGEGA